jgi:alpha-glucosidase
VAPVWWRDGVLYQIYPRSFQDSDGDGIGDLRGVTDRLDHLQWLGVDGIWLNPTFPSPNRDWGYDVADYYGVHPELGTQDDLDRLIAEARRRGIRVLLDLVPNHTSDQHPWFRERPELYVWSDDPPNNWRSQFGGPAWSRDEGSGRHYLHNFLPEQPDLDWWNEEVREEFDRILRHWFDRGVAGFRIDVCHAIVKDRELRDDPASTEADHPVYREKGWRPVFSMNRPEVHDVLRRWRRIADSHGPPEGERPILVGETYVLDLEDLLPFYGTGSDELHLAFNFLFVHAPFEAAALRAIVEQMEAQLPEAAWPVWTGSNHDAGRLATRWAGGGEARARAALLMLLTLRGTPFLYYGDEIGLPDVEVPADRVRDPVGPRTGDPARGRDGCRTPMHWDDVPGAGFTGPGVEPWLPVGDTARNVAAQREDPGSTLHLVRDLVALRRRDPDLRTGVYRTLPAPDGAWAYARGDGYAVALNLAADPLAVAGLEGTVAVGTDRARDGERVEGPLRLAPGEAVLVAR